MARSRLINAQIGRIDRNIKSLNDEEHDIDVQIAAGKKTPELIARQNLLIDQMNSTRQDLYKLIEAREKLVVSKSDYITAALDASEKADAAVHAYDAPHADKELAAAIDQFNLTAKPKVKLGPSAYLKEDLDLVKQCKADVESGVVPVTADGGVPNVDVLINGKFTTRMVWDSGCGGVTLSAHTAKELGLHASSSDEIEEHSIADGSHIKVHVKQLEAIRIGPYTVENVRCTIPAEGTEGADLLGTPFQSCFQFKLDMANQILKLTPLFSSSEKKKNTPTATANGHRVVDLLDGISVADQSVKGAWEMRDGSLYSDLGDTSRIDFNYRPPMEYDYKVTFTKLQGDEAIGMELYANGRQFTWVMGGWGNKVFAFEEVNAVRGDGNSTTLKGRSLETGKTYNCVVQVRPDGVSAYLDGQLVERYQTDYRDMNSNFPLHRQDSVGLMTHKTSYVISSAQVVEIKGQGTRLTASDPVNAKVIATASYEVGSEHRSVKIFDNGHFDSPNDNGMLWYLQGHSVKFVWWGWAVDEFVLSDDMKTFKGRTKNNFYGELTSGSFNPEKENPQTLAEQHAPPAAVLHGFDRSSLPGGLVLYLPFDRGDDAGAVAHDRSPAHLVLPNHDVKTYPDSGAGLHGTADFDGQSWIDCKAFGEIPSTFTLATWVKAAPQSSAQLIDKHSNYGDKGILLQIVDGYPQFVLATDGFKSVKAADQMMSDKWYHLAGTFDGTVMRLYVNGNDEGSKRVHGAFIPSTHPLEIGRNNSNPNETFTGMLSEVMIYNRALTADEVAKLAGMRK
jgi:Concanavalin A-like lectin/glucanases superfamily/Aspartyl protease